MDISYGVTEKLTLSLNVPFLNNRRHEHIDGIGTATLEFTNQLSFFASASHRFITENSLDYEFGDSTFLDGGISYRLNEKISLIAQINTRISRRDKFLGMEVPNTGATFINVTPGIVVTASENVSLYTHVQIPVYQRVNEVTLVPNFGILAGLSYGF